MAYASSTATLLLHGGKRIGKSPPSALSSSLVPGNRQHLGRKSNYCGLQQDEQKTAIQPRGHSHSNQASRISSDSNRPPSTAALSKPSHRSSTVA